MGSTRGWGAAAAASALSIGLVSGLLPWACPFLTLTGLPCPGCGLTRAARAVAQGDFAHATSTHPLIWLVAPALAALAVAEVVGVVRHGTWGRAVGHRVVVPAALSLAGLLFAVWLLRFAGFCGGPVR